jgi:aminotransferase
MENMMRPAARTSHFGESTIREMTRLAIEHKAINLSQGYPDFDPPAPVLQAAAKAILEGANQYTITWGFPALRNKLAALYRSQLGWGVDPDVHITVTCGVTEAIAAAEMAVLNPGDEIIILEPAHENFRPATLMVGAVPVAVPLEAPAYRIDPDRLKAAITGRTRALLLNTPHNPTGRVFDAAELAAVVDLVLQHDLIVITDEIYDRILYDGRIHRSPGGLEPLRERTITVGGLGKSFAVTGWRLGYIIAPSSVSTSIRKIHDYMTICAPTPLQAAAAVALDLPSSYFTEMATAYHQRRDAMLGYLEEAGFRATLPEGAYYTMADYTYLDIPQATWDSTRFAMWMTKTIGVAVVPGASFYSLPGYGLQSVRFAFPKKLATLQEAGERLQRMKQ